MTIDRQDILDRLTAGDDVVRYDAVVDAVAAQLVDAIAPIARLLSVEDVALREASAEALGVLGAESAHHREEAMRALIEALGDSAPRVRARAAEALGDIGDPDAIAPLSALLADGDELARTAAAEALADIGDNRAHDALAHAAELDPSPAVRGAAIRGLGLLGKSGDGSLVMRLAARERDPNVEAELFAARARFGEGEAVAALVARLDGLHAESWPEPETTLLLDTLDDLFLRDPPASLVEARAELTRALTPLTGTAHADRARGLVAVLG